MIFIPSIFWLSLIFLQDLNAIWLCSLLRMPSINILGIVLYSIRQKNDLTPLPTCHGIALEIWLEQIWQWKISSLSLLLTPTCFTSLAARMILKIPFFVAGGPPLLSFPRISSWFLVVTSIFLTNIVCLMCY